MFRAAPRLIARSPALYRGVAPARRHLSTAPPTQKSRSWKSLFARFGIAGTIIYYYNTTDVFAEEPNHTVQALPSTDTNSDSENLPTIESITAEREKRKAVQAKLDEQRQKEALSTQAHANQGESETGMGGLEEEADQQGAFNPETGEINWDCPCLGGMADGPCGPEFKEAFSCFVFSKEEPKGMDCIDRFKNMQNCFREHPDVYGSEMEGDDAEEGEEGGEYAPVERGAPEQALRERPASKQPASVHATSEHPTPNHGQSESIPTSAYSDSSSAPPPKPQGKPAPKSSQPQDKPAPAPSRPAPTADSTSADKAKHSAAITSQPQSSSPRPNLGLVPDDYKPSADKIKDEEPTSESEQLVPKSAHDAREEGTGTLERK